MKAFRTLAALLLFVQVVVAAPVKSEAASAAEIDAGVGATLQSFQRQFPGARELGRKAAGVLVFPSVVKAGIGFGGEYGEGLLIIHGRRGGYYNLISGSFGFQLGVQVRSVIIMFMTERALASFQSTYGWRVGVDASARRWRLHRHRKPHKPRHWLHSRSGWPDVQFEPGRLEDQPYFALSSPPTRFFRIGSFGNVALGPWVSLARALLRPKRNDRPVLLNLPKQISRCAGP